METKAHYATTAAPAAIENPFGCIGDTIQLDSNLRIKLTDPDPQKLTIKQIAGALSKICRFGGRCPQYYSVAEHCVLATELARREGIPDDYLASILMHDAAEAYLGDIVTPLKALMQPIYKQLETRFETALEKRFGVVLHRQPFAETIRCFDRIMLVAEARAFWPNDTNDWGGFGDVPEVRVDFNFLTPNEARYRFLCWANELGVC